MRAVFVDESVGAGLSSLHHEHRGLVSVMKCLDLGRAMGKETQWCSRGLLQTV